MYPRYTENWLGAGSSKFFVCEQPERVRSTDAAVRKRKNAYSIERVRKRKQPKTHVPLQRFSMKQRYKNNTIPPKKQRYTTATTLNRCNEIGAFSSIFNTPSLKHLSIIWVVKREKPELLKLTSKGTFC